MSNLVRSNRLRKAQRGFTLIELLVSMTVLALILGFLGTGLRTIARNWDKNVARIDRMDMIAHANDIFRRDVRGLLRLVPTSSPQPTYIFEGRADGMSFIVAEPPYPTQPGLYFLRYSVAVNGPNAELVRSRAQFEPEMLYFPGATPANRVSIMQGLFRYRFSYGEASGSGIQWHASWPFGNRLPDLIQLQISDAGGSERNVPPIVAAINTDAEISCIATQPRLCSPKSNGALHSRAKKKTTGKASVKSEERSIFKRDGG